MGGEIADERAFKATLRAEIATHSRERLEAAMEDAVRIANAALADTPPAGASMDEWHMEPIAESVEIRWEPAPPEDELTPQHRLVAEWKHEAAGWIELGVQPHLIEGNPVLAWDDPETGETVFRHEVEHPGIPGVGYARQGFVRSVRAHFGR